MSKEEGHRDDDLRRALRIFGMGHNQPGGLALCKREKIDGIWRSRAPSSTSSSGFPGDDGRPLEVTFPRNFDDDSGDSTPSMDDLSLYEKKNAFPVVFKWRGSAYTGPAQVYVCGSWDDWKDKIPMAKSTSDFSTILELAPGSHEYKFEVDGKWVLDDNQPKTCTEIGGENNIISVDKGDFEVFSALDKDLEQSHEGLHMKGLDREEASQRGYTPNYKVLEKLYPFTQELPDKKVFEKAKGPPMLPPHLMHASPLEGDPDVLPQPSHVMLNHIYTVSRSDNVMVLSATRRYRKKYVTTLLYKPC